MTKTRIQRLAALLLLSSITPLLLSCSGSDESNLDVLAEWRKNAPSTSTPASAAGDTRASLPTIPEGADPFAQENYRLSATRSYMTARGHVRDLTELAGEFDLGSDTWASGMRDMGKKFNDEAAFFVRLNPPVEYEEKHQSLVTSMELISKYIEDLDAALVSGNFTDGADAIAAIQDETNTMVKNGRFEEAPGYTPTTVPAP